MLVFDPEPKTLQCLVVSVSGGRAVEAWPLGIVVR